MRKIIKAALIAMLVSFPCPVQSGQEARMWVESYEEAQKIAAEENRDIYVVFEGRSCVWCQKQKEVLASEEAGKFLSKFVVCVLNVSTHKDLGKKYKVSGIPDHRVFDYAGNQEKSQVGYMSAEDLEKFLSP